MNLKKYNLMIKILKKYDFVKKVMYKKLNHRFLN